MANSNNERPGSHDDTYVGHTPLDFRDVTEILLAYDDDTFIEQLIRVITSTDERFPTQEGPRVLQRDGIQARVAGIKLHYHELYEGVFLPGIRKDRRFDLRRIEEALDLLIKGHGRKATLPPPETLTHLLSDDIPPPIQLFEGLMHEGMLLFGGKSKRGKSWLMFDLAIALNVGRAGFRHFACEAPRPVLYLALEDGRARLQSRAKAIQPTLTTANTFHLRYTFPDLTDGGIEALTDEIARHQYGLVIIDVLAKLERPKAGKSDKNYHDIYEMFTPLQELRKQHPFCLAMLTHLRKQEADDVFDTLMGSVAYQGAQDVLWVLERKPKDDYAYLHIRDKDAEDKTIALRFLDGHWEYIGEGDEYEMSRDQRKILKILVEENAEMGIEQLRKAGEWKDHQYGYVRKLLVSMAKDDLIHHSSYGKYSATIRALKEVEVDEQAEDGRRADIRDADYDIEELQED